MMFRDYFVLCFFAPWAVKDISFLYALCVDEGQINKLELELVETLEL